MSYVEQSLGDNETVHSIAAYPTGRFALAWMVLIAGLVGGLAATLYEHTLIGGLFALCAVAAFCWILYRPWTTEIAVTNLRLIYKRGFFQRRANDLQLSSIEEVRLRQSFWGRIFNFGHVELYGTGVADLKLPAINDPVAFQKSIQEALGADKQEAELPGQLVMPSAKAS
ncbi:PH domain-containing protein [Hyphomicrobium sp.]|jgi:hypothetical protein|uniref:PH domain-containing protein n=1 Tax=Hyphomicrobium sp. TaxID=82 RepID=UPI003561B1D2